MTTTQMYWLVMLDSIHKAMFGVVVASALVIFGGLMLSVGMLESENYSKWFLSIPMVGLVGLILAFLLSAFLPTTKQMAAILVVPKIINNAKVQEIPDKLLGLAEAWMEELKPKSLKEKTGR